MAAEKRRRRKNKRNKDKKKKKKKGRQLIDAEDLLEGTYPIPS